jgi:photosystem II stability/assembly factor-like uncharacterized protein
MKKRIALLIVLQIALSFNSCSSDSGDTPTNVTPPAPVVINTTIKSYSKDYGTTGETITMTGENFSTKISEIKITFDGVAATILSATATEIAFTLPATEKLLPKLVITIENRTVTNSVVNNYNGGIGILPIPPATNWFAMENGLKSEKKIGRIQMLSDKILYFSTEGGGIYRTLDGGITWSSWALQYPNTGFHLTSNNEGWCYVIGKGAVGVSVMPFVDKPYAEANLNYIWKETGSTYESMYSVYVEDNMKNGTFVSQKGSVYTTENGIDINKIRGLDDDINIFNSTEIDNNHIWVIGYKDINGTDGYKAKRPFLLFKNNTTDGWKEYAFVNEEGGYYAREICFVDTQTGFLLVNKYYQVLLDVKLFKTTNGGDTWLPVYNNEKFTKFTFKDAMTGWAILDNKIYKTVDGAVTWTLDYTHDQPIRNIGYKNNVVWAFSKDKIIKRYL